MTLIRELRESFLHLFFPHLCSGCGSDIPGTAGMLCLRCISNLPETNFECLPGNPVEKTFWGRLPLNAATAQYYFTKESLMQQLMHQFKYKGNRELGLQLGKMIGEQLLASGRFSADMIIPLPLFPDKERKRGYNQATVLCRGMAESMHIPVREDIITRPLSTITQTKKGRVERWKNMEGKFMLLNADDARGKCLLLVDDVVTTGATLEACGQELLKAGNVTLKIAALCAASR